MAGKAKAKAPDALMDLATIVSAQLGILPEDGYPDLDALHDAAVKIGGGARSGIVEEPEEPEGEE